MKFRIETYCKHTGAYQGVEVVDSREELIIFCTEPWRRESVHVAYSITPGLSLSHYGTFVAGRCVSPHLNDLHR